MSGLKYLHTLSVREDQEGRIEFYLSKLDLATRRTTSELLLTMEQPPGHSFTPDQLLCMAAAENLVKGNPLPLDLPF